MSLNQINNEEYDEFRILLAQISGITLSDAKQYLVRSRLQQLVKEEGFKSLADLNRALKNSPTARLSARIIDAMTTNETSWFRDILPYEYLRHVILPDLVRHHRPDLRIWSAACSSGEEPYSISMTIHEYLDGTADAFPKVEILATDISSEMIKRASIGLYDDRNLGRGVSPERRERFFADIDGMWAVIPGIRELVTFRQYNLNSSYSGLGMFDVIFCRNVLIYFSNENRRDIVSRMAKMLKPGGFLVLGSAETIEGEIHHLVRSLRAPPGMVYRRKE